MYCFLGEKYGLTIAFVLPPWSQINTLSKIEAWQQRLLVHIAYSLTTCMMYIVIQTHMKLYTCTSYMAYIYPARPDLDNPTSLHVVSQTCKSK